MASLPPLPLDDASIILPTDLAHMLGVSLSTLERWRCQGGGPAFLKIGRRRVGYRTGAVRRWLAQQERANTAA